MRIRTVKEKGMPVMDWYIKEQWEIELTKMRKNELDSKNVYKDEEGKKDDEWIRYIKKSEKSGKWSPKMRYFGCGEYGENGTERSHWHVLMWNLPREWYEWDPIHEEEYSKVLEEIWGKGMISIGIVNRERAAYCAGYMMKQVGHWWDDEKEIRQKPMQFMSKNPGIGNNWVNDEIRNYLVRSQNNYVGCEGGFKQPIGTYYKKKIYGDEKEKWEYKYEVEEGRTVSGETGGIQYGVQKSEKLIGKPQERKESKKERRKRELMGRSLVILEQVISELEMKKENVYRQWKQNC